MENAKIGFLSGNSIKLLACLFMTLDHIGLIFFPNQIMWRIVGRIAMPLFAFMIAEGAYYTKNRIKHFLMIFCLGVFAEIIYVLMTHDYLMNILLTFSASLLLIYFYDLVIKAINNKNKKGIVFTSSLFSSTLIVICVLFYFVKFDYNFFGLFIPFAIYLTKSKFYHPRLQKINNHYLQIGIIAIITIIESFFNCIQAAALFACIILLFYNHKRGKLKLKYFFYFYYPLHLGLIYLIYMLINNLSFF